MDIWDIEELAYRAMGKTKKETDEAISDGGIEDAVYEKYECSFDTYCTIIRDVINFTPLVESTITNNKYHAFVDEQQYAIVKVACPS